MSISEIIAQLLVHVRSAWRFRWYGTAVAWTICLLGWGWVVLQPDVYEARARVYVDSSSVLRPILENRIVPPDVATQLAYIRQALLGRTHLERVARENSLDVAAVTMADHEYVLQKLRSDIEIFSNDYTNTVYNISYRDYDRQRAVGVVNTLLTSLVEDTLGASREGTDTVERFLEERILEYENRLQQAEAALADFKKRNADRLPGNEGGYFERLREEQLALEDAQKRLRLAESKRDRIVEQLQSESPVAPGGLGVQIEPAPNSLDARIRDYQAELDRLLLRYKEAHPDVENVRDALARLEQQRLEQLLELGVSGGQELSSLGANPIYQSLRIALNEIEVEIEALTVDVAERQGKVRDLQALIDEMPEVEAEFARLNRDYDVIYDQYHSMVRSREVQDLSRKASETDGFEFRVIDPPIADFEPVAPNRVRLLLLVFVAALGAAGGLCWFVAEMRPVFHDAGMLRTVSGLPVFGTVSQCWQGDHRTRRRLALLAFGSVMSALAILLVAGLAIETMGDGLHALAGGIR